jgi:hypothetical protein
MAFLKKLSGKEKGELAKMAAKGLGSTVKATLSKNPDPNAASFCYGSKDDPIEKKKNPKHCCNDMGHIFCGGGKQRKTSSRKTKREKSRKTKRREKTRREKSRKTRGIERSSRKTRRRERSSRKTRRRERSRQKTRRREKSSRKTRREKSSRKTRRRERSSKKTSSR